jgi:hypothetical protein
MPDTQYDFTHSEQSELDALRGRLSQQGGLYACDAAGEMVLDSANRPAPLEYVVLRSLRYLLDPAGRAWRFFAEGTRKNPAAADGGGAPWRNNRVEMWNGRWRRVLGADGAVTYHKVLVSRPLDKRINGQPGKSQLEWYCGEKRYRHPLDEPHAPTDQQAQELEWGSSVSSQARPQILESRSDSGSKSKTTKPKTQQRPQPCPSTDTL